MREIVTGKQNVWCTGAQISVVLDTTNSYAYLLNADIMHASKVSVSDEIAASAGLPVGANLEDVLQIFADASAGEGITRITVVTEDGDPIPNVALTGLQSVAGTPVTTDAKGTAIVVCHALTSVKFEAPYFDIPIYTENIQPSSNPVNYVTVTMPFIKADEIVLYSSSQSKSFWRNSAIDICLVGGGGGGGGLRFSQSYTNISGSHSGVTYGGGGGAVNSYYGITPSIDTTYSMVIGSGGSGGAASSGASGAKGGTTTFMGYSAVGGNGAGSAYHSSSTSSSSASVAGTSASAVTNGCASGATAKVYPFGDSTIPASGGGGGASYYTSSSSNGKPYGGHNPNGGGGGWKYYYSSNQSYYSASAEAGTVPGGGGGGHAVSNFAYSTSYSGTGGNGASGGVYIRLAQ